MRVIADTNQPSSDHTNTNTNNITITHLAPHQLQPQPHQSMPSESSSNGNGESIPSAVAGRRRPRDEPSATGPSSNDTKDGAATAPIVSSNKRARAEVRPFFVHQWLDVCDMSGKWYEAQVIAIERKGTDVTTTNATTHDNNIMARIHYKGLHARYDEWLQYDRDRHRYDILYTHTERPRSYGYVIPRVGVACDMRDTTDAWLTAQVKAINDDTKQMLIHYTEWSDKYDEWVDIDTPRLAPRGTFTKPSPPPSSLPSAAGIPPLTLLTGSSIPPLPTPLVPRASLPAAIRIVSVEENKAFAASQEEENKYRELLQTKNGFIIIPMASDGNCLFRSVSNSVYGVPDHHTIVRAKCMEYMEKQSYFFKSFVEGDLAEYIARLRRDGEWGDHVELQAITEIYDRPVEIFAYSTTPVICFGSRVSSVTRPPIRLSYHSRSHYNAIVHPSTHSSTILTSVPGDIEDHRIRMNARPSGALEHATYTSDMEATERESMALALQISRQEFATSRQHNQTSDDLLQAALQASLKQHQDLQTAQATEALRVSRAAYEQQQDSELAAAIAQSMVGVTRADSNDFPIHTAGHIHTGGNGAFDDEEQLLNQAIFSSLLDSRPSPSPSPAPSSTLPSTTARATPSIPTVMHDEKGSNNNVAVVASVAPSGDVFVATSDSVPVTTSVPSCPLPSSQASTLPVVLPSPSAPLAILSSSTMDAPTTIATPIPSPSSLPILPTPPPATVPRSVAATDGTASPMNAQATANHTNVTSMVMNRSQSMADSKASSRIDKDTNIISDVVNHCHHTLKYPLTKCVKAYSIYASQSLSPRELQHKMIAYLSSQQSSSSSRSHSRSPTAAAAAATATTTVGGTVSSTAMARSHSGSNGIRRNGKTSSGGRHS